MSEEETSVGMTREQREEAFREFHADQLRQQTKHLHTIQAILSTWLVLTIIGIVLYVIAAMAAANSSY